MPSSPANPTWREFFDSHAPHYLKNSFTAWTQTEVTFLLERMRLPVGASILDLGCGVGRHALEFARRGYQVTGVDVSEGMIAEARRLQERGATVPVARTGHGDEAHTTETVVPQVSFIVADATTWTHDREYDACVCLCEGGFGLADLSEEPVSHDLAVLRTAHRALRPGAPFVLTALNGYSVIRKMTDDDVAKGVFDPSTMISHYRDEWDLPEGRKSLTIRERLFISPELVAMLRHVGFDVEHVWGGTAGEWGERPLKLDEVEAMYWCRKRAS
jgi:SAM-dependent methyltransferase